MNFTNKIKENVLLLAAIAAFCGGSIVVAAKIALEVFEPFTLVFIRFFSATLFLLPLLLKKGDFNVSSVKKFIPIGVVGALNPILLFIALPYTKASVSPLIYACVPALTAIYMYFWRHEKIGSKNILGILVGLVGVALIILLPLIEKGVPIAALKGNLLIFLAAIAFMFYGVMSKQHQKELGASPIVLTFYFALVTMFLSIPFVLFELRDGIPAVIQWNHILAGVYTGIIGTGIFYLVYQYALKLGSELAAAVFTYLQPIATILLASIFLGERITIPFIIGGLLAVTGAKIASKK
jgi:drug/metabolite transporter (DMT)-like permease